MSGIHLNVKIHYVDALFVGSDFKTAVWVSQDAAAAWRGFASSEGKRQFAKKLKAMAEHGFEAFTGKDKPIRPEGQGVLRIGISESLFRVYGFMDPGRPSTFIAIEARFKKGQQLNKADRMSISRVAKVKERGAWRYRKQ